MTRRRDRIVKVPRPEVSGLFEDARPEEIFAEIKPNASGRGYDIWLRCSGMGMARTAFASAWTTVGARRRGERMVRRERARLRRRADRRRELGLE